MMKYIFSVVFLLITVFGKAQNIKTIQLKPVGADRNLAIVPLGTVLELSFDDLDADNKDYQYKIEQMTHDWQPSSLSSGQYVTGFDQNTIFNIQNSFNTLQGYTHYSVKIPNDNTEITKSGNYLLSVLTEDDELVFSRRFVLYENRTTVGVSVSRSRNAQTLNTQQTVQFLVNYDQFRINNPAQEINVVLMQNFNWNTAITGLQPQFFQSNRLVYNYTNRTNFWGENEYLHFDSKYIRNTSINVARIERKDIFHNYLYTQEPRAERLYTYAPDTNGQFVVRTLEGEDAVIDADYAMMHFGLAAPEPYDKDVYVYGGFNNFQLTDENRMTYNEESGAYEASILFKQGFYNYLFATVGADGKANLREINGSFFETENEYTVIVYYKPFGGLYDRAIGVGNGFFNQNR